MTLLYLRFNGLAGPCRHGITQARPSDAAALFNCHTDAGSAVRDGTVLPPYPTHAPVATIHTPGAAGHCAKAPEDRLLAAVQAGVGSCATPPHLLGRDPHAVHAPRVYGVARQPPGAPARRAAPQVAVGAAREDGGPFPRVRVPALLVVQLGGVEYLSR